MEKREKSPGIDSGEGEGAREREGIIIQLRIVPSRYE